MKTRTTLIMVSRVNGVFTARSQLVDAIHPSSASIAARRCAAQHFDVSETELEIAPAGDGVLRATVIERSKALLWWVLSWVLALVVGIAAVELITGGRW